MLDVDKTIKNLIGLKLYKENDDAAIIELQNDIICAFDSSEEHDIYVETDGNGFSGSDGDHRAYENTEDSPTIEFYIEDGEIIKAW